MQAGVILTKMACYIIVALHSADVVVAVRKVIFVWSAQAGLDLPVVDVRIQELLPLFLTFAASFAMVVEVGYMPFIWHLMKACCCNLNERLQALHSAPQGAPCMLDVISKQAVHAC